MKIPKNCSFKVWQNDIMTDRQRLLMWTNSMLKTFRGNRGHFQANLGSKITLFELQHEKWKEKRTGPSLGELICEPSLKKTFQKVVRKNSNVKKSVTQSIKSINQPISQSNIQQTQKSKWKKIKVRNSQKMFYISRPSIATQVSELTN